MRNNRVIVGVDGSSAGTQALTWAAAETLRRGASLTVLCAYTLAVHPAEDTFGLGTEAVRRRAEGVVARASEHLAALRACRVAQAPPADDVEWKVVAGTPAGALVNETGQDRLVVVGQRGLGGFDRVVLGSVSSAVAAMARGPVVVVPSDPVAEVSQAPCDGVGGLWRVVAAIDLDDHTDHVLRQAFAEAEDAGSPLLVVHAVHPELIGPYAMVTGMTEEYRDEVRDRLSDAVTRWADKFPHVQVTTEVVAGIATDVVLQRIGRHDVVVVGGRRHSPLVGRVLASVADRLVRHARCPVLIAHQPR